MRVLTILALLIVSLWHAEGADEVAAKAAELFEPFRRALGQAIDPWEEGGDASQLMTRAAELADEHVLKLGGELRKLARRELKGLEPRDYDLGQYETRFELELDVTADLLDESGPGLIVYRLWSPKQAAEHYRTLALSRRVGPAAFAVHALRDSLAPTATYAVSTDPLRPVLAVESGSDLCLVKLEYAEPGFYKMTSVLFAKRAG